MSRVKLRVLDECFICQMTERPGHNSENSGEIRVIAFMYRIKDESMADGIAWK